VRHYVVAGNGTRAANAAAWILRPLHDIGAASTELRACECDLREAVDRLTLEQLRRVLVGLALLPRPTSLPEARNLVAHIKSFKVKMPEAAGIELIPDCEPRNFILALRSTSFVKLRNAVVHDAYRPSQEVAEAWRHDVFELNRRAMKVFGVTPRGGQLIVAPTAG
jgi:hypothetical protein